MQGIYRVDGQTGALLGVLASGVPGFTEMQFASDATLYGYIDSLDQLTRISVSGAVTRFGLYPPLTGISSFVVSPGGSVYFDALDAQTSQQGIYGINGSSGAFMGALVTEVPGFTEMQFAPTPEPSSICTTATLILATALIWRRRYRANYCPVRPATAKTPNRAKSTSKRA